MTNNVVHLNKGVCVKKREKFVREAERLSQLPRAERFNQLIDFPTKHLIKVIGRADGLENAVRNAMGSLGYSGFILVERRSAKGRFISLSFELDIDTAEMLDKVYTLLEQIPEVTHLL